MSDSDSTSDSDISQGWTILGSEGPVDSSDHDSDIVILKPEEVVPEQIAAEPDLESQSAEALEVSGGHAVHEAGTRAESMDSAEELNFTHNLGTKSSSLDMDSDGQIQSADGGFETLMKDDFERSSSKSDLEETSEKQEHVTEVAMVCGLSNESRKAECESLDSMKYGAYVLSEDRNDVQSTGQRPSSSDCLPTCSRFLPIASGDCKQNDDKRDESDAAVTDEDDDDDDAEDDDEQVVRKFHEATFHSHSFHRPHVERIENQENSEDDEGTPPDVDDRCESDISGVADDSDSDLSSLAGIDDIHLNVGEVVRTYRHQPNPTINFRLTLMTVTAVLFALGIGIGHYIGSTRDSVVHQQQILRIKTLQNEYFVCLREMEKLESRAAMAADSSASEKISAVMAIWRKKYEELVLERAELEYRLNLLQSKVDEQEILLNQTIQNCEKNTEGRQLEEKLCDGRDEEHDQELRSHMEMVETQKYEDSLLMSEKSTAADHKPQHERYVNEYGNYEEELRKDLDVDVMNQLKIEVSGWKRFHDGPELTYSHDFIQAKELTELRGNLNKKMTEIDYLRNSVNQLMVENSDLKAAIQSQRYKEHPGNSKTESGKRFMFSKQNKEFADRKVNDQRMNGETETAQDTKVFRDKGQHSGQRQTIERVVKPSISEFEISDENGQNRSNGTKAEPTAVDLVQFFLTLPFTSHETSSSHQRSSNSLAMCFSTLVNIYSNHTLYDLLLCKNWRQVINQAQKVDPQLVSNHLEEALSSCHHYIDFKNSLNDVQNNFEKLKERSSRQDHNGTFQHHVKTLRKMVNNLGNAVESLMKSMKGIPKDFAGFRERQKIKNAIKNWGHAVISGWKKIDKSVFVSEGKVAHLGSVKERQRQSHGNGRQAENGEMLGQGSVLGSVGEKSKQGFEGNRKQTESSSSSHQKYEEFWKWNHFDPDDFLQEGFFEDNQREWHKHQKRLRKISGRIQRLTEEMLLSMDDDDIEDIYEDIDDLADDLEGREIPEQLRTWLTCQTRWWRSRVQRKHRNEDLVKGCGQQLVRWQLRVICKENQTGGGRKRMNVEPNKLCKTVISTQGRTKHTKFNSQSKESVSSMTDAFDARKPDQNTNSVKEDSGGNEHAFSNQVEYNSVDTSGLYNQTYPNHGAYDLKSSWYFQWGENHASCSTKPCYYANRNFGKEEFPKGFHPHQLEIKEKAREGRMLFCREDQEFNGFVPKREQWCRK